MDTLVDKIVRGQAKVDQMKAEIKTVTGALWGWLRKNHPTNDIEWFVIPCGPEKFGRHYEWKFTLQYETKHIEPSPPAFWIQGDTMSTQLYSDICDAHLDDIATVHASLEKFVEGMLDRFPELKQFVIMPLWDAAGPDPATTQSQQV